MKFATISASAVSPNGLAGLALSDAPRVLDEAFRQMLGKRHQPVVRMAPDIMGSEDVTLQDAQTYRQETVHDDSACEAALLLGSGKTRDFRW